MTCTLRDDDADVAEFSAGVHADAAADGAGDSGQAFDAGQALADGAEQQFLHVQRRRRLRRCCPRS